MASTYLTRTYQSGGNRKKWTMSMWVKRSKIESGADNMLFQSYVSTYTYCPFDSNDRLRFQDGSGGNKRTNMKFRDTNAWYHIVVAIDTDLGTADDRYKIYVNGNRITDFETSTNPSQGYEGEWNKAQLHNIGRHSSGSGYFDGYMTHIHFCDGYQYQASDFGETDSATGIWKPKTSPSVNYGTTGFFILKDGNSVTDSSSNTNNWTINGTLTNMKDNPSNVFATFNPLFPKQAPSTTNMGNTRLDQSSGAWKSRLTTIGASSGKYYAEFKAGTISGTKYNQFGVVHEDIVSSGTFQYVGDSTSGWGLNWGGNVNHNGSNVSGYTSFTTGDIIGVAMDLDNHKVYWRKNDGAWLNSGDPTSGSTGTGAQSLTTGKIYFFAASVYGNECFANFGNGYFGTTAVSSAGTNASGIGIFEYDVPTGYTALSTKGLNE